MITFGCCDKGSDKSNLKKKRIILAHGFSLWSAGFTVYLDHSEARHYGRTWQSKGGHFMIARKQRDREKKRERDTERDRETERVQDKILL
jgi:hypothetical protein